MELRDVLTIEDIKKLEQIDSDVALAKEKIDSALKNDLGIQYLLDVDSLESQAIDFTATLNAIPSYLEIIKQLHNDTKNILEKAILNYINMKQTELNQEQFLAVEGWIKNFPITSDGSSMLSQFNKYFAPKQIPNEAVCKEAKHNEREMAVKEAFKQIMNDIKSPQMAFLSFNIDDFFERERPKAESEIKIGDRVKLKGDSNSPEMTVIGNASQDASYQYKGVKDDTIQSNDILKCSWFPENEEDSEAKSNRPMQTVEIHRNALQVIK